MFTDGPSPAAGGLWRAPSCLWQQLLWLYGRHENPHKHRLHWEDHPGEGWVARCRGHELGSPSDAALHWGWPLARQPRETKAPWKSPLIVVSLHLLHKLKVLFMLFQKTELRPKTCWVFCKNKLIPPSCPHMGARQGLGEGSRLPR